MDLKMTSRVADFVTLAWFTFFLLKACLSAARPSRTCGNHCSRVQTKHAAQHSFRRVIKLKTLLRLNQCWSAACPLISAPVCPSVCSRTKHAKPFRNQSQFRQRTYSGNACLSDRTALIEQVSSLSYLRQVYGFLEYSLNLLFRRQGQITHAKLIQFISVGSHVHWWKAFIPVKALFLSKYVYFWILRFL